MADVNRRIGLSLAGDLQGEWDPARMYQVLSNLIGNATRFGDGKAEVSADGRSETVEIAVHNDGPPIPAEVLPLIFEPFNRGPDKGAGLGLGLYIAREIVRSHDGEIAARSSIEGGTTFTIRLDDIRPDGARPCGCRVAKGTEADYDTGAMNILVVDVGGTHVKLLATGKTVKRIDPVPAHPRRW